MGIGERIAAGESDRNPIQLLTGTVVSVDGPNQLAVVNIGGGTVSAQYIGTQPLVSRPVFVILGAQTALILGSPAGPALGTISSAADGEVVDVTGDDGIVYTLHYSNEYDPVLDDRVLLDWDGGGHIVMPISGQAADPVEPVLPPPVVSPIVEHEQIFRPSDSASWYSGRWNSTDVIYGQSYPASGWFYGPQMRDSIGDTAEITYVGIYVEVTSSYGNSYAELGTHGEQSRPGGPMPINDIINAGALPAGFAGEIALPLAWGDLFKLGGAFGVGTKGNGFRVFRGAPQGGSQGAIRIKWKE